MVSLRTHISVYSSLFLLIMFCAATRTHAQSLGGGGSGSDMYITFTPHNPGPRDTITATVTSASTDISQSLITWTVNGKQIESSIGDTQFTTQAQNAGSSLTVRATADTTSGNKSAQVVITPTVVDLLLDSNSYIPPFYKGRALPSHGSGFKVQTIPYLVDSRGARIANDKLIFTWSVNGIVKGSLSGLGKNILTVGAPILTSSYSVDVVVHSSDNTISGAAHINVPVNDPLVELYVNNPRYGTMYSSALLANTPINDIESTFRAVPYFAAVSNPNDPRLIYSWDINGIPVPLDTSNPSKLTINAANSNGAANISLSVTHSQDFLMDAEQLWSVVFNKTTTINTPTQTAADPFHATPK
ncbi:MAG: seg [Candidatus Kaiserbacteria bacterium]|nr:seg [Candidatus Kaiserbacteria bacterium]